MGLRYNGYMTQLERWQREDSLEQDSPQLCPLDCHVRGGSGAWPQQEAPELR